MYVIKNRNCRKHESSQIVEAKCPVCKRIFIPAPYHAYLWHGKKVCSYKCQCRAENESELKKQARKAIINAKITKRNEYINKLWHQGLDTVEIAGKVDLAPNTVQAIITKLNKKEV